MRKKKKSKKERNKGFSNSKLLDLVVVIFKKNPRKSLNYKQISKILKIKEAGIKIQLIEILRTMVSSGALEEVRNGSFRWIQKTTSFFTKVVGSSKKGVFIVLDNGCEVFIPKELSCFALPEDEVEVLVFPKRKNKFEGEVVSVIKRKKEEFVGVIDNSSVNCFLLADDRRVFFDVFLPKKKVNSSFLNKKVLVKVESWDNKYKNPVGKVVSVIGDIAEHNTEINSILFDYGFSEKFPSNINLAAKKLNKPISSSEIKKRLDIRKTTTFTIDPKDAKDFDDALSVKKLSNGLWEVGVHIADVSHYVVDGDVIDLEAAKRGTSVYLVDRVIPMLPEVLSNDLCSLKPKTDRLAYSVFFQLDNDAFLVDYKIKKTIIHSDFRFTYESAQEVIDKRTGVFADELILLNDLSKKLRYSRQKNGSINFENSEVQFILDENNNPLDVFFKKTLSTNHLIEEFMLLANKTIAKHVGFAKQKTKPFIYRTHDLPDKEKILTLNNILKKFKKSVDIKNPRSLSFSLNKVLENFKNTEQQQMIETLVVRSMSKALYTVDNIGHYGLGFDYYSHFTSPIRRYPDLIVHRILEKYLLGEESFSEQDLSLVCKHCSEMEKLATKAERDSIKYMQVKFLKNKVGTVYNGIISGVTDWGIYVEIIENKCEGLVKISSIKNDHYVYDDKKVALIGYRTKNIYQLGQKVKVKLLRVNLERKQLDFILN